MRRLPTSAAALAAACVALLMAIGWQSSRTTVQVQSANGLRTATFQSVQGLVTVHLPDDLAAGDTISGTVAVAPAGNTDAERQRNADELNGRVIQLGRDRHSVSSVVGKWVLPAAGTAALSLLDGGRAVASTPVKLAPAAPPVPAAAPKATDFQLPTHGQAGRPAVIVGPFDGDLTNTQCAVGGQEVLPLAESPRSVVVSNPPSVEGKTTLQITERGVTARGEYRTVRLALEAQRTSLMPGERTTVTLNVSGLASLERSITVRVRNLSPGIVRMEGGDLQDVRIAPDAVSEHGSLRRDFQLIGIRSGTFTIAASGQQMRADCGCLHCIIGGGCSKPGGFKCGRAGCKYGASGCECGCKSCESGVKKCEHECKPK